MSRFSLFLSIVYLYIFFATFVIFVLSFCLNFLFIHQLVRLIFTPKFPSNRLSPQACLSPQPRLSPQLRLSPQRRPQPRSPARPRSSEPRLSPAEPRSPAEPGNNSEYQFPKSVRQSQSEDLSILYEMFPNVDQNVIYDIYGGVDGQRVRNWF